MQLVAYGAQDVYLTGNPQITFFKVVYRRHTNFACEAIEQTFNGTPALGGKATVPITRNGDLVTKMWLHTTLACVTANTNDPVLKKEAGYALIKSVELQIGGTKIDKHYGQWMQLWGDLTRGSDQDKNHRGIVGSNTTNGNALTLDADATNGDEKTELFVPLQFFCCRNDGLALPLIALQYHDVRLEFEFNASDSVATAQDTNLKMSNTTLLVNYIYLDSEERKRFAQASHEYLIEQLQFTGIETASATAGSNKIRLNFNHPVKELVWVHRASAVGTQLDTHLATTDALLQLNGHDRFSKQSQKFFNAVQTNMHHTRSPSSNVCVYSFALNPEEHQPSGTCNFSRIDNATLNITTATANGEIHVYGVNYNVLRIMSGMGGVAHSN
jgi:hypothetical protein